MERAAKKQKLSIEANNTSIPEEVPVTPRPQLECTATNVMDTCDVPIYKECETHKALQSEQAKQAKQDEPSEKQDANQPEEDAKQPAEEDAKQPAEEDAKQEEEDAKQEEEDAKQPAEEDAKQPAEQALEPKATWKAVELPEVAANLTEENLRSIGITQSSELSVMHTVVSSIYPGGISDTVWEKLEEKRKRIKDVETLDGDEDPNLKEKCDAFEDKLRQIFPSGCIVSRRDNINPESSFAQILKRREHVLLFVWHEYDDCDDLYDDFRAEFKGEAQKLFAEYKNIVHWERLDGGAVIVSIKDNKPSEQDAKQDAKQEDKPSEKQDVKSSEKPSEQDNHAALDIEIDEALEILEKHDPKVLQKENERVIKDLSKYVKKGKEKFVFKHLAQAQRYSDNVKKRGYHIKAVTADNVWLSETLCNNYIQRYVTEPSLTEVYIQYGFYLEREEKNRKRNVYGLDDDGNLRSMTKKQMCNEINATFGALDSRYAGPLTLRKL